jgi:hypothetical protein
MSGTWNAGCSRRSGRAFPAANGSRSELEPWTVTTLAELLRETTEHEDHYEKTHRIWQKISCTSSNGM